MDTTDLQQFTQALQRHGAVESILAYPHPLHPGGLIVFAAARGDAWLDLVGEAYRLVPQTATLHCLRPSESELLAQPGLFAPPMAVNEFPHLLFWLLHRGQVLYGKDVRPELPAPRVHPYLLAAHVDACTDTLRRYGILPLLLSGHFPQLVEMLALEARRLMTTALLMQQQWDVSLETVPGLFLSSLPDPQLADLWQQLCALSQQAASQGASEEDAARAVWLFESFRARLEDLPCSS